MTYHVKFTNAYKKGYKRAKKRGLNLQRIDDVVDELRQGHQLDAKYRDHALHGNWEGFRECHIHPDWLLIYLIEEDILTLTLAETGTHAAIFNA
ncbi:MAG: type II toxin-antitoxin system YafQ family toxin [Schwartzia sp. (in: firmicutes)]